ncbi:MAG: hypothetical protein QF415_07515 [Candidatus Undinarchaeales archaeon]|jgi:hypothetical protein|nr:hypothetical protein [Candidatus Undinarchaeales archaeon]MDP7492312.1 hypothetical protein [Candidatus Undinarchaeales archaeon]
MYDLIDEERPATIRVGLIRTETSSDQYFMLATEPYDQGRVEHYISLIDKYLDEDIDVLVAPEYTFFAGRPLTVEEKDELISSMAERTKDRDLLLLPGSYVWCDDQGLHNTLPVIYGGEVIRAYDKKVDGGDQKIADRYWRDFVPGTESGVIPYKDLELGVEVCADHFKSNGRGGVSNPGQLLTEAGPDSLDLQLIVSCGMSIHERSLAVRENGYALICDGKEWGRSWPSVEVVMRMPDTDGEHHTQLIDPTEVHDDLHIYELSLNK